MFKEAKNSIRVSTKFAFTTVECDGVCLWSVMLCVCGVGWCVCVFHQFPIDKFSIFHLLWMVTEEFDFLLGNLFPTTRCNNITHQTSFFSLSCWDVGGTILNGCY